MIKRSPEVLPLSVFICHCSLEVNILSRWLSDIQKPWGSRFTWFSALISYIIATGSSIVCPWEWYSEMFQKNSFVPIVMTYSTHELQTPLWIDNSSTMLGTEMLLLQPFCMHWEMITHTTHDIVSKSIRRTFHNSCVETGCWAHSKSSTTVHLHQWSYEVCSGACCRWHIFLFPISNYRFLGCSVVSWLGCHWVGTRFAVIASIIISKVTRQLVSIFSWYHMLLPKCSCGYLW